MRLAYSILGERTSAEDAAQDALLRVWRALGRFRSESSLSTWIYSIARNTALSARASRRTEHSLDDPHAKIAAESFAAPAAEQSTPDLMRMVGALPDSQRQVVILFYLEGKSYIETAATTVKTYLHRARKELALAIENSRTKTAPRTSS